MLGLERGEPEKRRGKERRREEKRGLRFESLAGFLRRFPAKMVVEMVVWWLPQERAVEG